MEGKNDAFFRRHAESEYEYVLRKGFQRSILNWLYGRSGKLLSFDEIRGLLKPQNESSIGMREIPMDKIVGSVSRYNDFDDAFLPRQRHTRDRWVNIDVANLKYIDLPPIDVYKIGDLYFVKDGNHRVSVAREKGQQFIDANVIEIHTTLPIDKDTDLKKLVLAQERFDFFERTKLRALIPEADINLTLPGQYEKLLEHIAVHRYFMGETAAEPVSEEDAVKHWYDDVYTPLAAVIQKDELLADFPGRTTADLYLWIVEHMWYLREGHNKPVTMEEAAQHFTRNYSRTTKQRLRKLLDSMASFVEDVEKNPEPPMSEPPNPEDEAPSEAS